MAERHRGSGRPMDRGRGRDGSREGGRNGGRDSWRPGREGRDGRDEREGRTGRGRRGEGYGGGYGGAPPFRERRPFRPPPPAPAERPPAAGEEQFEEVDADLAAAILETAARLTAVVGTAGLPEGYVERREAVLETFDAVYHHVLDTVTGADEEETDE